jgi:hypothetical protein
MIAAWLKPNLALGFILPDIEQTIRALSLSPSAVNTGKIQRRPSAE